MYLGMSSWESVEAYCQLVREAGEIGMSRDAKGGSQDQNTLPRVSPATNFVIRSLSHLFKMMYEHDYKYVLPRTAQTAPSSFAIDSCLASTIRNQSAI